jgi:hypothetical protein
MTQGFGLSISLHPTGSNSITDRDRIVGTLWCFRPFDIPRNFITMSAGEGGLVWLL